MIPDNIFQQIPTQLQRQDAVLDQLQDLRCVANRLGMYDAADALSQIYKMTSDLRYACHVDFDIGEGIYPGCVIDCGEVSECNHAKDSMRKEQCQFWRIVLPEEPYDEFDDHDSPNTHDGRVM